jgi:hypothetical protein
MKGRILIISLILLVFLSPLAGALVPDDELYPADDLYPSEIPDVEFTISANITTITESNTEILLTVWKNQTGDDINSTVEINTTDGSAIAGSDYIAINENLTFEQSETNKTVALFIKDNVNNKPPKTFTVALSNPTGNATLADPSSVEITIVNQFVGTTDEPGTIGIIIAFIAALLGIFPAIVDLIVSAGVLAVVTILAGVLFTFITKLKLGW